MRKFRGQPAYNKDGRTNFLYTKGKAGVYLIYKDSKLAYIGMSKTNLYRTMYRHFQSWDDPTQIRVHYNAKTTRFNISCRVVLCTPAQAVRLERMLILKHKPKDNPMKYLLYQPVKIDKKILVEFTGTPVEVCPF